MNHAEGLLGFRASQVLPPGGEGKLKKRWAGAKASLQASQPDIDRVIPFVVSYVPGTVLNAFYALS